MIIHTIAYKKLDSLNENLKKLEEYIVKNRIDGKINLFFLGEQIFTNDLLDEQSISLNKYTMESN